MIVIQKAQLYYKMEPKVGTSTSRDQLKMVGGRLLMLVSLIVNIITTIGVVLMALKIRLYQNPQTLMFQINDGPNGHELWFNEDIQTDTLIVGDRLGAESISHEQISVVGKTESKGPQPEISLNPDYISMQAKIFGPDGSVDNQFKFKIDRELDSLEISSEANNVRSIRAGLDREDGLLARSGDLSVESSDELELSGNLGLTIHARDIVLRSKKSIIITSRENVIDIRSAGGLFLPNVQFLSQNDDIELNSDDDELGNDNRRHLLCIRKSDGSLYRARIHNC